MPRNVIEVLDGVIEELVEGEFFDLVSRLRKIRNGVTYSLGNIIDELEEGDFLATASKLSQIKQVWTKSKM